jgi:hypothetical protein
MLKVYGEKNGERKLIFASLHPSCLEKAKKTAKENGYTITEIWETGALQTRWADKRIF